MFNLRQIKLKSIILISTIVVGLFLFLKLSAEVWEKESIINIDQIVSNWVYTLRTPFITSVMKFITSLAGLGTIAILFIIFFIVLIIIKKSKYIIPLIITVSINFLFVQGVKILFARPRPETTSALITADSFSFPSGHTLIAITFYGFLILYLLMILKSKVLKYISVISGAIIILSVGFSRIYLGVHWPSDVIASLLIGTVWLSTLLLLFEYRKEIKGVFEKKLR
ncbi:phosphatase PAP2 family protein [Candidatus Dojkabacteria bacterium]|jgi:undecaprenyl-diphosphatase|nr:phosphatase PAP2 family protein [Candidatus Dojkabacteria bacterium]